METIRHRVGISAPVEEVYEWLATPEGIARWWCADAKGDSTEGGRLELPFGSPNPWMVADIAELRADERVAWRVTSGPPEWIGSQISFDLKVDGDETVVLFAHREWREEPAEMMGHCSTKWASFLLGAKHGLEGGKATPYPDDPQISSWR